MKIRLLSFCISKMQIRKKLVNTFKEIKLVLNRLIVSLLEGLLAYKFFKTAIFESSFKTSKYIINYHSLYNILDFDWLIHLQITACKYRSAANIWCKYFIEHAHFENASSASIKKYLSFKMPTWLVLPSYQKANCSLY